MIHAVAVTFINKATNETAALKLTSKDDIPTLLAALKRNGWVPVSGTALTREPSRVQGWRTTSAFLRV